MSRTVKRTTANLSRREASGIFLTLGGLALGCDDGGASAAGTDGGAGGMGGQGAGADASSADATSADVGAPADGGASSWATGGTRSMTGGYADPFLQPAAVCVLAPTATAGPCTEAADQVRRDISEDYPGLPMRLALQVLTTACVPIAGAKVKVWHTQISGSYSGNTPSNAFCLKDQVDSAKHYFRGAQTTDANGRVDFDSCFPGWYPGRMIHIHYSVSLGARTFTSQLVFDQHLVRGIFATHPEYVPFGQPDRDNASDGVTGGGGVTRYLATTSRLPDGALMAAARLVVDVV